MSGTSTMAIRPRKIWPGQRQPRPKLFSRRGVQHAHIGRQERADGEAQPHADHHLRPQPAADPGMELEALLIEMDGLRVVRVSRARRAAAMCLSPCICPLDSAEECPGANRRFGLPAWDKVMGGPRGELEFWPRAGPPPPSRGGRARAYGLTTETIAVGVCLRPGWSARHIRRE